MTAYTVGDMSEIIDLDRYPLDAVGSERLKHVVATHRRSLATNGVAILPEFVRNEAVQRMACDGLALQPQAHLEDVWSTPYLDLADESYPEGHPRRTLGRSLTWVIAYDLIPRSAPLRVLYEWDPLKGFIAEILQLRPLYRMADPLGALNVAVMDEGHTQCWHYDNADFVVSLALQASHGGGQFECAARIRKDDDENYDNVARVLAGQAPELVEVCPMVPGTLMIFAGRHSVHRVSPVEGNVPRIVALLAYDTRPDSNSSDLFKVVRYGRHQPIPV